MKLLLLGADGQVGFELARSLQPLGTVICATRSGLRAGGVPCVRADLDDFDSLRSAVAEIAPRYIVNAAAWTAVDKAEDHAEAAQRANGLAPGVLGEAARASGATVVHFSTDYVFAG
jgi:dTDP-4-dehydrorhamnose reductase